MADDGVRDCQAGAMYFRNLFTDRASECAAELIQRTGENYTTQCTTENIGDGLPLHVYVTYCRVIKGQAKK